MDKKDLRQALIIFVPSILVGICVFALVWGAWDSIMWILFILLIMIGVGIVDFSEDSIN